MALRHSGTLAPPFMASTSASNAFSCLLSMLALCHTAHLVSCCCAWSPSLGSHLLRILCRSLRSASCPRTSSNAIASAATPAMLMHASGSIVLSFIAIRPYTLRSSFASRKSVCAVPNPREYPATGVPSMYPTRKCAASCRAMRSRYEGSIRANRSIATARRPGAVDPTARTAREMPPMR